MSTSKINLYDVVQIDSLGVLNKNLHGVIGVITEISSEESFQVSIYYPMKVNENAWVKTRNILKDHLTVIGQCILKPKL